MRVPEDSPMVLPPAPSNDTLDELSRLNRALQMLRRCNHALIRATHEADLLSEVCRLIVEVGGYAAAWIGYAAEDAERRLIPVAQEGIDGEFLKGLNLSWADSPGSRGRGPSGRAIRERAIQIVHDVHTDPMAAPYVALMQEQNCSSIIALPLLVEDRCIGVLDINSARANAFDAQETLLLSELADDLAHGIRTLREASGRRRQDARISRLTRALKMQSAIGLAALRINERDELLQEACRIAIELGGYDVAAVSIVDPDARYARPTFRAGRPKRSATPPVFSISDGTTPDTSLTGLALRTGKLTVCDDISRSELPVAAREALYHDGVRSMVALPLIVEGSRIGVLTMTSPNEGQFVTEELALLNDVMTTLSFALHSQQRADAVRYLAYFDPLTGLARRSLFCRRLESRLAHDRDNIARGALVAFSIDRLGNVYERFGGGFVDLLLKEVAERLRRHAEDDDLIGYLAPAEFLLIDPSKGAIDDGRAVLLDSELFATPFSIEGHMLRLDGVASAVRFGADSDDADALVQKASVGLAHARRDRAIHRSDAFPILTETPENLALERRLQQAVAERQFELHYLTQIDFASARVTAVEALLRWHDPDRGMLSPAVFLRALECTGLIHEVGDWVFRRAIDDGMRWQALGMAPVRVAVNVSGQQLHHRGFVEQCLGHLERWQGRTANCGLDIEVTESGLLQDIDSARRVLPALRAAGVRITWNDFGANDASLGVLSKIPVDVLKIDRSVIRGMPEDAHCVALATASIEAAKSFGLDTVAVGVEKPSQLELLKRLGCGAWQGYLHGRPAISRALEVLLASFRS